MRKENWRACLNDKIEEYRALEFQWGVTDCMQFAAACIGAVLERDFLSVAQPLGRYSTEQQAKTLLDDLFLGDLGRMFDAYFTRHQNKTAASAGDAVIVEIDGTQVCGVIDLSGRRAVCKAQSGLVHVPIKYVLTAWRIE